MPVTIAKADPIHGWKEMGHARIEHASPGRQERWYYYNPRWPYALFVCQGARIESYMRCSAILCVTTNGFGDSVAPRWVTGTSDISAVNMMDISREGDPAHWKAGYYKVTVFPSSTRKDFESCSLTLSQTMDQIQAEAIGPMMAIMTTGIVPPEGASEQVVAALQVAFDNSCRMYGKPDLKMLGAEVMRKSNAGVNDPRRRFLRVVSGEQE